MRYITLVLIVLTLRADAFEMQPWFSYPFEVHFRPSYFASYYPSIEGSVNPLSYNSWNQLLNVNMGMNTMAQFDTQIEVEFFNTKKINPTLLSVGAMGRYLLLDDVEGDPLSLSIGISARYVPDHALRDPFDPYHNIVNFESHIACGKEIDRLHFWVNRFYGIACVGIANVGAPWIKGIGGIEFSSKDNRDQSAVQIVSYFGFGEEQFVNVDAFYGYAKVWHQSVDLSAVYRHAFEIWGTLSLEIGYRVYAKNYPELQVYALFKYDLPFSLF